MSFNRLNYDMCQYKQSVYESTGPGNYMLGTPPVDCDYCYPSAPTVRLQKAGDSIDRSRPLVDTDSELSNRSQASKCIEHNLYRGGRVPDSAKKIRPGLRTQSQESSESFVNPENSDVTKEGLTHWPDCFSHTIESRHLDPPSNLRGTGFDRWEWLCFNPQEKAAVPFDYNISNRIVVKDNHRPCIPKPIDQKLVLPPNLGALPCDETVPVCSNPTHPSGVKCDSKNDFSS